MKVSRKEWFYIPNLLTMFRLVTFPIPLWCIATGHNYIALGLICLGILTDVLDGYLARRLNQISELGKILDPLSDKLAVASLAIFLCIYRGFPLWAVILIIARDLAILIGGLIAMRRNLTIPTSNMLGKLTALAWSLLLLVYLTPFTLLQQILLVIAAIMVPISFAIYLRTILRSRTQ
ncbi:MAG: CDP-alcohol phosphatidyltransferase family protein [bacterium]